VTDLSRANNDMNNLLAGTGIGTVFVDHQLRISRYTPAATPVINLIPTDIGRPVGHIVSNLVNYDHNRLVEDLRAVLDNLVPRETQLRTRDGTWYLMRIRPYRTLENVIEGAVLTFVDVTERKQAEDAVAAAQANYRRFFDEDLTGACIVNRDEKLIDCNPAWLEIFGFKDRAAAIGSDIRSVYIDPMEWAKIIGRLHSEKRVARQTIALKQQDGRKLDVIQNVAGVFADDGTLIEVLTYVFDISGARLVTAMPK
jgi:two-component system CheB/CheR fusion protein